MCNEDKKPLTPINIIQNEVASAALEAKQKGWSEQSMHAFWLFACCCAFYDGNVWMNIFAENYKLTAKTNPTKSHIFIDGMEELIEMGVMLETGGGFVLSSDFQKELQA